jgi:hypothetical protein
VSSPALAQTLPLGAAAVSVNEAPKAETKSEAETKPALAQTVVMADAPAKPASSAPLPAFDLPVSAPKLPPAPVSESDVAKTAVYKPVNAADIVLPEDDLPAPKKNTTLFVGIGVAAVVAILAGVGFAMSSSDPVKTAPSASAAPPKAPTADIPPPPPANEAPSEPPAKAAAKPTETAAAKPESPKAPTAAPKPEAPKGAVAAPKPPPPAAPAPAPKPAGKPGGIVRDAPF